ncbi:unknown [[Mannheimia] succiniciproducens MBEL55E]|uniref:Uncharacterized protein n=1 Tax=Mannheimia succiniciproducens (strain KCTC 0769BP / MBEL55E) TaxID=221988 RepID=Q65TC4_MANSM|nr:unknown [[Mannheimia] succiniciproducens MBEL55E]
MNISLFSNIMHRVLFEISSQGVTWNLFKTHQSMQNSF